MIAKHIPIRSGRKSDFFQLVKYITNAQGKTERLGQVNITNCEASYIQDAIYEVMATQQMNTRATGDKTYHLIVSFPAGEVPSEAVLKRIEERICMGLGYGEHQRISAVHHDTDHLHIHIAINKIHPTRRTMNEPFQSYRTLGKLCTELEKEHVLQKGNHNFSKSVSENHAIDMEKHSGIESLVSWIRRTCLNELLAAPSWQDLHDVLCKNGLTLCVRANGFVIASNDGTMVKASTVNRHLSKNNLEVRLGPFEAPVERIQTQEKLYYQKEPIRLPIDTEALYAQYKAEQKAVAINQPTVLNNVRHRKSREINVAKRANRLRISAIKLLGEGSANKKLLYALANKVLRTSIQSIQKKYQKKRQVLYSRYKRYTWVDWLQKAAIQGNSGALTALRAREGTQGLKGNTIQGEGQACQGPAPIIDTITKKGTIIFRVGKSAVRDDGYKLQVSREATYEGLQAALRLAIERYGNRIIVNGTTLFKAQIIRATVDSKKPIIFADPALECQRQDLLKEKKAHDRRRDRHSAIHS